MNSSVGRDVEGMDGVSPANKRNAARQEPTQSTARKGRAIKDEM